MQANARRISSSWVHLDRALRPGEFFEDFRRGFTEPRKRAWKRFHRSGAALKNNFTAKQRRRQRPALLSVAN